MSKLPLFTAALMVAVTVLSSLFAEEPAFCRPDGRSVPRRTAFSGRHALVVLAAPWDGMTKDLLDRLEHHRGSFRGRIRTFVVLQQASRSVANRYMGRRRYHGTWFVDEAGTMLREIDPPVLPYVVLLGPSGDVLHRTPALTDDMVRLLGSNPERFLRERSRRIRRGIPTARPSTDEGPWGPPRPRDSYLEGTSQ